MAIKIKKRYQGRQREVNNDVINQMIKFPQLRVIIESTKEQLGVVTTPVALKKAEELNLDLVLISDKATPPVAKIMDYGKYRYEKKKQEQLNKKNQKITETKEIRLSANIGVHDLEVKFRKIQEFIERGDKVKLSLKLRGRELNNKQVAEEKINWMLDRTKDIAKVEKYNKTNNLFDILLVKK